jgi:hypothetical protein
MSYALPQKKAAISAHPTLGKLYRRTRLYKRLCAISGAGIWEIGGTIKLE